MRIQELYNKNNNNYNNNNNIEPNWTALKLIAIRYHFISFIQAQYVITFYAIDSTLYISDSFPSISVWSCFPLLFSVLGLPDDHFYHFMSFKGN